MPTMERLDPRVVLGIAPESLPRHVAVIMDGNGRWARQHGWPRERGHEAGAANVRETVTECARLGIECLTLYSFSVENWRRPAEEVAYLMDLYVRYLIREREEIMANDIRLIQVGRRMGLPPSVLRELEETISLSSGNQGMTLCLAINYGGRSELIDAVRAIARRVAKGELDAEDVDEEIVSDALYTRGLPDPDLLIRTAGEMRISNFLLWQISYAELYVTETLWPDFHRDHLHDALRAYARRVRRFGRVVEPPQKGKTETS
jgi:undecaprenyl diphosphate synthase